MGDNVKIDQREIGWEDVTQNVISLVHQHQVGYNYTKLTEHVISVLAVVVFSSLLLYIAECFWSYYLL